MACVADVVFLIKTIFLKIIIILIFRSMSVGMNYLKYFGVPHHRLANLFSRKTVEPRLLVGFYMRTTIINQDMALLTWQISIELSVDPLSAAHLSHSSMVARSLQTMLQNILSCAQIRVDNDDSLSVYETT